MTATTGSIRFHLFNPSMAPCFTTCPTKPGERKLILGAPRQIAIPSPAACDMSIHPWTPRFRSLQHFGAAMPAERHFQPDRPVCYV